MIFDQLGFFFLFIYAISSLFTPLPLLFLIFLFYPTKLFLSNNLVLHYLFISFNFLLIIFFFGFNLFITELNFWKLFTKRNFQSRFTLMLSHFPHLFFISLFYVRSKF
jgi:hypothetical protein